MSEGEQAAGAVTTPDLTITYAAIGDGSMENIRDSIQESFKSFKRIESPSLKEEGEEGGGEGGKTPDKSAVKEEGVTSVCVLLGLTFFAFPVMMIMLGVATISPMFIFDNSDDPAYFIGAVNAVSCVLQLLGLVAAYFSDRCTSRFGRRRPFILAGGILFILGCALLIVGFDFQSLWTFVCGSWVMALAGGIVGQANSALVTEVTAKSKLAMLGGFSGLWAALGGFAGLIVVAFFNIEISGLIFGAVTVIGLVLVLICGKERPLPEDSEILLPLKKIGSFGEKFWFVAKDFVTSYMFSIKRFPDFFLYILYRGFETLASGAGFAQFYLSDIMHVTSPEFFSAVMSIIRLLFTLINAPIFGCINNCHKRPRLTLIGVGLVSLFVTSIYIWAENPFYPVFLGSVLSGIASGANSPSSMPVVVSVLPSRARTAQHFGQITFFELIFSMIGSFMFPVLIEAFEVEPQSSSSLSSFESFDASFSFSSWSESSSVNSRPQKYSRLGYTVSYGVSMLLEAIALVLLMFINTGRSKKAQEQQDAENKSHDQMKEHLLSDVAGESEDKTTDDEPATETAGGSEEPEYVPPKADEPEPQPGSVIIN